MTGRRIPPAAFTLVAHTAFAAQLALLLVAVGQPVFTDDVWWHLGLGEAFSRHGPWLAGDPLLFTAPRPPDTAAWLFDAALFRLWQAAGYTGLRIAHVTAVAGIVALAWSLLRREGASAAIASAAALAFVALSAQRLVQLRPELVTIGATLALYGGLVQPGTPPSPRRLSLAALGLGVWANCHAAFLLGPLLLAVASVASALSAARVAPALRAAARTRATRLAIAWGLAFAATLVNPDGIGAHLAWFESGGDTPELGRVADEWAPWQPLRLPVPGLPPSPLAWTLAWLLLVTTPIAVVRALPDRAASPGARRLDPALGAWGLVCLAAPSVAVRFLWLGFFPLLVLARAAAATREPRRAAFACAGAALLAVAFVRLGDWPSISGVMPRSASGYAQPYAAAKYYAHPIWFLVDAGLEGHVFADYPLGGFVGFFGAPRLTAFVNGSLNVSREAIEANRPIRERRGARDGEDFLSLLERMQIDIFLGTRLPLPGPSGRPWFYTTAHLEGAAGWVCVFRNLDSAVYLRSNARNAANLERVVAYYARERVPYEPGRGCEPDRVIRGARAWALSRGVVPMHFEELIAASRSGLPDTRRAAAAQLASLYAALGLYERAIQLDRRALRAHPDDAAARRRLVWALLRLGRVEEAARELALTASEAEDPLLPAIAEVARAAAAGTDAEALASQIKRLPVLLPGEAAAWMVDTRAPEARARRGP